MGSVLPGSGGADSADLYEHVAAGDWNLPYTVQSSCTIPYTGWKSLACLGSSSPQESPIYDDLKCFNYSTCPLRTQCVLASTHKKDRGLRSVVNKVVTQIVAKTGGCPCAQLPFMDGRSMVIGVDVFNRKGVDRVTGFCATTDKELSRYVSFPQIGQAATGSNPFEEVVNDTFASFRHFNNGAYPNKVFVFRDGTSDGQKQDLKIE